MTATLYLGTHEPSWLRTAGVPLFVSHRRLSRLRRDLPVAAAPWALDSGGFSELSMFGAWQTTARAYVDAVVRYDEQIGRLEWAAPQDWMCEPDMVARTGLSVAEHQVRTVRNYVELCALWRESSDAECPFMPVLQGYAIADYRRCIDLYGEAGVDLAGVPLVGVGSVCRRQHTSEIRGVFEAILETDPDMPVHGFGVKSLGLREYGHLLTTCDSMAWSYNARRNPRLDGCTHASCSNCIRWALRWRRGVVGPACAVHGEPCDGRAFATCFAAPASSALLAA
ncbi:queuine tRNA-ribosyltransferase [Mycobacterium phage Marcoliusprime]|uniref:Queuine tRNA-ribosyltransferase n=1 Tax=Mycobacterium phage Findley TaxID=2015882 RepID=A0A222ZR52_9CAUD|nr:queuine tRNA-ribosyltransferase [Mycobacterium phage Milly]YP_009951128.1 queuine tRNA-ribosyltransferase [Mycobacterium phage Findley]AOZ64381.1 queuine tRNA-ribosyltransferase [Mycobacterium phage Marcoliusprime]ASR86586.1 queuine tRNA-ribosyltransferase [Mycobacterium phage DismalFunk]AYB68997.1 queuine tRNA-ribosyltransferase [Mycobacterium phage DismalStressor]AJA43715.1 queuine tRNA-ribosyltransferase [Mycobacterium phage Milly]ASR86782.1 queuine tRNA-ribosyltransferase [Mycobacteriu